MTIDDTLPLAATDHARVRNQDEPSVRDILGRDASAADAATPVVDLRDPGALLRQNEQNAGRRPNEQSNAKDQSEDGEVLDMAGTTAEMMETATRAAIRRDNAGRR